MISEGIIAAAGIAVTDALMVESAIEYITANTMLTVDVNDAESIKALPASAKLFIQKYSEVMSQDRSVTSESIAGMSQSFDTGSRETLLLDLLKSMLGGYMKSQMRFIPAVKRWA